MLIGLLAGSVVPKEGYLEKEPIVTRFGPTSSGIMEIEAGDHLLLAIARHGIPPSIPPHRVDHRSNIAALKERGAKVLISVCSTGALRKDIPIPVWTVPDDYIDLISGSTFNDDGIVHITPGLDSSLQRELLTACGKVRNDTFGGTVHVQSRGPRLETKAEVRLLSGWGDVVGMSLGPEATLGKEMGLRVGAILTVDNLAHGLSDEDLDFNTILRDAKRNWADILKALSNLPGDL